MSIEQWNVVSMAVQSNTPIILWGEPGIGKSRRIEQLAKSLGYDIETVIASIREPSDFCGLPVVQDGGTVKFAPPDFAHRLMEGRKSILFLDEISTAPAAVQAALMRVVLDRTIGDFQLPKDVAVIAAANPAETTAGCWDLSAPLANRFAHINVDLQIGEWTKWAEGHPVDIVGSLVPEGWEDYKESALVLFSVFLKSNSGLLHRLPKDAKNSSRAWPSPRSWEMASTMLAACRATLMADMHPISVECIKSCVGDGAMTEFLAWRRDLDLPDPTELLANPKKWKIPKRSDIILLTLNSLAIHVIEDGSIQKWEQAWEVLDRIIENKQPDLAAMAGRKLARRKPEGAKNPKCVIKLFELLEAAEK